MMLVTVLAVPNTMHRLQLTRLPLLIKSKFAAMSASSCIRTARAAYPTSL